MSQIKVYSKIGTRLGSTSKAFDTVICEELMREFTLSFSIANTDAIFRYIAPDMVYECQGELFDITDINTDNSGVNVTTVSAEHVSYRLSDYIVPTNYAFIGTAKEIGADILKVSGADAEFVMGDCADVGTQSFELNNDKETTARAAIIALKSIGVEICFSNFNINLPKRVGAVKKTPLKLSRRKWQKGNGWTYEVDIADTGNISVGDTFPIVGDGVEAGATKRIITHERHLDDPSQTSVALGVFVRDDASASVDVENKVDNSVQQGEKYSNVKITHTDGFVAENKAGTQRVMMNADDCFVVQTKQNDKWVTVNSLELFGLLIDRLTSQEAKDKFYIQVGKIDDYHFGLRFFYDDEPVFDIGTPSGGEMAFTTEKDVTIKSRRKTGLDNSYIELNSRNLLFKIDNFNIAADGGNGGVGYDGTLEFEDANGYIRKISFCKGFVIHAE